jgi:hypothetical protein
MLGAHYHDNRRNISSVKFQAYVYLGVGSYAEWVEEYKSSERGLGDNALNRMERVDHTDLLMYNALDAVIEYHVAMRQLAVLGWTNSWK